MNDHPGELSKGEAIERLLNEAFPELRCLRCGHDSFGLTYGLEREFSSAAQRTLLAAATRLNPDEINDLQGEMMRELLDGVFITLVCERCGMIERHLRPTLERSDKPIRIESPVDDQLSGH